MAQAAHQIQSYLYIPHGSDERITYKSDNTTAVIFISHMVQMKESGGYEYW